MYVFEHKIKLPIQVRGIRSFGTGGTGCWELPDVVLGNKFNSSIRSASSLKH